MAEQHLATEPPSEERWPSNVETKVRRTDWGDVAVSGATEVILMVWLLERTRGSFTAVPSHFVQKSSTGAVANGARKILVFHDSAKALVPVVKQQRQERHFPTTSSQLASDYSRFDKMQDPLRSR